MASYSVGSLESPAAINTLRMSKIPKAIDILLGEFDYELHDNPIKWKGWLLQYIPDPNSYMQNKIDTIDTLRKCWEGWKSAHKDTHEEKALIKAYEIKLERCASIVERMTEVFYAEDNGVEPLELAFSFQEVERREAILLQTPSLVPWKQLKLAFDPDSKIDQQMRQAQFDAFLANPDEYTETKDGECYLNGFPFHHCGCALWSRAKNTMRQDAERIIVEGIEKQQLNKEEMLRLVGFGAGGLLEDLIIIGKLIQKGFKNIRVIFVDPGSHRDPGKAKQLEEMLNMLPGVRIKALYALFLPQKEKNDAIYSTDLDELNKSGGRCWFSVFNAKENCLAERGKFYLFGDHIKLILGNGDSFQDIKDIDDIFIKEFLASPKLSNLSKVDKIKIVATKDRALKLNFNMSHIAKIIQELGKQFKDKPIEVRLYGNDISVSAFRLDGYENGMVLKKLAGKANLDVKYLKEHCSLEQQAENSYNIFLRELTDGSTQVSINGNFHDFSKHCLDYGFQHEKISCVSQNKELPTEESPVSLEVKSPESIVVEEEIIDIDVGWKKSFKMTNSLSLKEEIIDRSGKKTLIITLMDNGIKITNSSLLISERSFINDTIRNSENPIEIIKYLRTSGVTGTSIANRIEKALNG